MVSGPEITDHLVVWCCRWVGCGLGGSDFGCGVFGGKCFGKGVGNGIMLSGQFCGSTAGDFVLGK